MLKIVWIIVWAKQIFSTGLINLATGHVFNKIGQLVIKSNQRGIAELGRPMVLSPNIYWTETNKTLNFTDFHLAAKEIQTNPQCLKKIKEDATQSLCFSTEKIYFWWGERGFKFVKIPCKTLPCQVQIQSPVTRCMLTNLNYLGLPWRLLIRPFWKFLSLEETCVNSTSLFTFTENKPSLVWFISLSFIVVGNFTIKQSGKVNEYQKARFVIPYLTSSHYQDGIYGAYY